MKTRRLLLPATVACMLTACMPRTQTASDDLAPLTDNIRFGESVLVHGDTLLVANFGSEKLDPLNREGNGYILLFEDTLSRTLVPADGSLSAPKGMLIVNGHLFVADVGKVMVFDLGDPRSTPQTIAFPDGELFVNDMALDSATRTLYITVTNTGNIYSLNVSDPAQASEVPLTFYTNVPGANGIVVKDGSMWIASYPADGVTVPENVIYHIPDIASPRIVPLLDRPGQYDGLALSPDGATLYFTDWTNPKVGSVDLTTGQIEILPVTDTLTGPARIQLGDSILYIPDLPTSRVVRYRLP